MNQFLQILRVGSSNIWHWLRRAIIDRWVIFARRIFRFPLRLLTNIPLLLYFLFVVCIVGALGAIIPAIQLALGSPTVTTLTVCRSLSTYVIAIAVRSFADCIVRDHEEDDAAFTLFLLGLALIAAGCAIAVLLISDMSLVIKLSIGGALLGLWIWLMVNDSHPKLTSPISAYGQIGGEIP